MKAIQYIRLIGKEFAAVKEEELDLWIEMVRPMVSKRQFGKLYDQAIAYLVCHKMKMAGNGESPLTGMKGVNTDASINSVSEGGSSISFGSSQSSNLATDAELGLSTYGTQFLQLRRMVIVPIRCGGEPLPGPSRRPKTKEHDTVPIASGDKLGGVKVRPGSGLKLDADGNLSIDGASQEDVVKITGGA